MSNFLALNGIVVPCFVSAGGKATTQELGTSKRAIDGTMSVHRRVTKQKWAFTLAQTDDLHARAFRSLVLGEGYYWSFDTSLYAKGKGKGPSATTGSSFSAGSAYLGAGKVSQTGGANFIQFTIPEVITSQRWSTMYARKNGAGAWTHYVATWDGSSVTSYVNGSAGAAQSWLSVVPSTGVFTFNADAVNTTLLDELVILPYQVPTDWPAQMYALNNGGTQWSDLARVNALGDAIVGGTRTVAVKGTAGEIAFVPSAIGGAAFAFNNQTFAFELEEV